MASLVALATIFPLTLPSLAFELMWNFGPRSPRMLDWNERKQLAKVIGRASLNDRLVNAWNPTQCIAMTVFVPMMFEGGHWVEVQPRVYSARRLSAGVKVYALPVPPDDPVLRDLAGAGFLTINGGTSLNSIVTLNGPEPSAISVHPSVEYENYAGSFQGARYGLDTYVTASESFVILSLSASHFTWRPRRNAMLPRWHATIEL